MNPPLTHQLTLYFDGGCPVSAREIGFYRSRRGAERIRWVDLSRCDDAELGNDLSRLQAFARLHVRWPDGIGCGGI